MRLGWGGGEDRVCELLCQDTTDFINKVLNGANGDLDRVKCTTWTKTIL